VRSEDIKGSSANEKASIHYISEHGIAGRGILIDFGTYAQEKGLKFDCFSHYEISLEDLMECAHAQGLDPRPQSQGGDICPGDILFVRSGWLDAYNSSTPEKREAMATRRKQEYAGLGQSDGMVEWLHDCYFAAVAGDAPSFEAWPTKHGYFLHEYLLALWGVPIGEMLDLERLSRRCQELKRWKFFFTSSPANCPSKNHQSIPCCRFVAKFEQME
jgi:kynurenine formamidase